MAKTLQLFSLVNFGYGENPRSERLRFIANDYEFKLAIDTGVKGADNKTTFNEAASVNISLEKIGILKVAFLDQYSKLIRTKLWEIRKEAKPCTLHNIYINCPGDDAHRVYVLRFVTGCTFDANQKLTTTTKWMIYGLENFDEYKNIRTTKEFPKDALLAEFTLNGFGSTDGEPYTPKASVQMEQFGSILEALMAGTHKVHGDFLAELKNENSSGNKSSKETYSNKSSQAPAPTADDLDDEFPF